ncbi:MAG: hypothetical protein QM779_10245 [Propionicimonas sp.]|uniref:hypothetical protein n=1 Tax=Propionicimonas sp. TaxID=1955623 RepID=UPI003D123378
MNGEFSAERSQAIRDGLVDVASARRAPRRRWWRAAGLVAVGVLAGAGATGGAFAAGVVPSGLPSAGPSASASVLPSPDADGFVEAPAGVEPGASIVSLLGTPSSTLVTRRTTIGLSQRPETATDVRVTVTCGSAGEISWGTDAGGNNPSSVCSDADVQTRQGGAWFDFALGADTDTLYVEPSDGMRATVTIQFLAQVPTRLGVNENGQTYGVGGGPQGTPDLVLVDGTSPEGESVSGYAKSTDLEAFSPEHAGRPENPQEAVRWQAERDARYPHGWDVPVYAKDGTTVVGTFHIG